MEPAAVLVAAFEIEALRAVSVLEGFIGGFKVGIGLANREPACAGVEPDVENVGFLAEGLASAMHTGSVDRQQGGGIRGVPGLDAFAFKEVNDGAVKGRVEDGLLAAFAHEYGDVGAPDALPPDAPVGPRGDHVGDAFLAPGRVPAHFVDLVNGELAIGGLGAVGALDGG